MANKFKTREEWLAYVTNESRPAFKTAGFPIPKQVRFSIGFTSSGARGRAIGECWTPKASADSHAEIFIKPTESVPDRVGGILWHELVHAAVGNEHGHKGDFKKAINALGFEGKATHALPSEATMRKALRPILKRAGKLPHASLDTMVTTRKKQPTRLLKAQCPECGYVVRVTGKWLQEVGLPYCGDLSHGRMVCEDFDGADMDEPEDEE